jgi:hypothetical protein
MYSNTDTRNVHVQILEDKRKLWAIAHAVVPISRKDEKMNVREHYHHSLEYNLSVTGPILRQGRIRDLQWCLGLQINITEFILLVPYSFVSGYLLDYPLHRNKVLFNLTG